MNSARPFLVCLALALAACSGASGDPSSAEWQELTDREEIRDLLNEYGRALDDRRLEEYAALFAQDGEWVGGFGTAHGPDGVLEMMSEAFAGSPNDGENRNYHVLSNMIVDVEGDRAEAWSRWTFYVAGEDGRPTVAGAGIYEDDLIREDGEWKFQRRVALSSIPFDDPREAAE